MLDSLNINEKRAEIAPRPPYETVMIICQRF